jgi:hypothetical protein
MGTGMATAGTAAGPSLLVKEIGLEDIRLNAFATPPSVPGPGPALGRRGVLAARRRDETRRTQVNCRAPPFSQYLLRVRSWTGGVPSLVDDVLSLEDFRLHYSPTPSSLPEQGQAPRWPANCRGGPPPAGKIRGHGQGQASQHSGSQAAPKKESGGEATLFLLPFSSTPPRSSALLPNGAE